eukprot:6655572-Prymnesium_polylepis.1
MGGGYVRGRQEGVGTAGEVGWEVARAPQRAAPRIGRARALRLLDGHQLVVHVVAPIRDQVTLGCLPHAAARLERRAAAFRAEAPVDGVRLVHHLVDRPHEKGPPLGAASPKRSGRVLGGTRHHRKVDMICRGAVDQHEQLLACADATDPREAHKPAGPADGLEGASRLALAVPLEDKRRGAIAHVVECEH